MYWNEYTILVYKIRRQDRKETSTIRMTKILFHSALVVFPGGVVVLRGGGGGVSTSSII